MTAADFSSPMSPDAMSVDFTQQPAYLEALVSGFKSPAGVAAVIVRIGEAVRATGAERLLIDVRQVIGQLSSTDHAGVGALLAAHIGPVRCAVIARADRPRGEIEPSARKGGVEYKPFDGRAEAVEWLLQGCTREPVPPSPPGA